jgi:hypothetical protein
VNPVSDSPTDPIGSIADEATKLFAAARGWAEQHPTPCGYCPICQLIAALPGDRPELGEKAAQALEIVGDAARAIAALLSGAVGADAPPDPSPGPRVQHIDIR